MKKEDLYLAGIYTRVSREDGDNETSESILLQRMLAESFCSSQADLSSVKVYEDDGYTGTSFERPAFQQMLHDIHVGLINCVVVKDLSRFGRDYIGVGEYLERLFPLWGVRFIAINDHIDSMHKPYTMLMPLSNVFNAQYAKDISQKVKSAIRSKREAGLFTGSAAPFGYRKSPVNKNRLIPDAQSAPVVNRIFMMYASGMGKTKIASVLNGEGIPCPSKARSVNADSSSIPKALDSRYWNSLTINRILHNRVYIGDLCQGKTQTIGVNGRKQAQPQENLIVTKGVHEAIIEKQLWDDVQAKLLMNARTKFEKRPGQENPLSGLIYCGQCGRKHKLSYMKGRRYYVCSLYKTAGPSACVSHGIYEDALSEIILDDINALLSQAVGLDKLYHESTKSSAVNPSTVSLLQTQLRNEARRKQEAYEGYREGMLSSVNFLEQKKALEYRMQEITNRLSEITDAKESRRESPWVKELLEKQSINRLDSATLEAAVEKIVVHKGKVEIWYTFPTPQI